MKRQRSRRVSKHDGTKITGRIKKGETTTTMKARKSRHKKSEGNKFIQPFLPPSVGCFDAEFQQGDGRMMPRNRPENAEERTAPFLLFLPLQRSKLREALGATHHKSATSTAAAAKSCLNLCEKLKPLGKLFVFSFLRLNVRLGFV